MGHKIHGGGWENFSIFEGNLRLSQKRYEIGQWLLWNVNRIPYLGALSNNDIFNDLHEPLPVFQGHGIFDVEYLKNRQSYYRTIIGNHT